MVPDNQKNNGFGELPTPGKQDPLRPLLPSESVPGLPEVSYDRPKKTQQPQKSFNAYSAEAADFSSKRLHQSPQCDQQCSSPFFWISCWQNIFPGFRNCYTTRTPGRKPLKMGCCQLIVCPRGKNGEQQR